MRRVSGRSIDFRRRHIDAIDAQPKAFVVQSVGILVVASNCAEESNCFLLQIQHMESGKCPSVNVSIVHDRQRCQLCELR